MASDTLRSPPRAPANGDGVPDGTVPVPVDGTVEMPAGVGALTGSADRRGARTREQALAESALLHAMRASIYRNSTEALLWQIERKRLRTRLRGVGDAFRLPALGTAIGRAGHRARFALLLARRTGRSLRDDGAGATWRRLRGRLGPVGGDDAPEGGAVAPRPPRAPDPAVIYARPLDTAPAVRLAQRVLLVAELSIPQCAKYRVWQRKAEFELLGVPCTVLPWHNWAEVESRLQTHTLLLFYRVPWSAVAEGCVQEARRLGVDVIWEVDDLIFDLDIYGANANLLSLPAAQRDDLLRGAADYRRMMLLSDRTIGSTSVLSELMVSATGRPSSVVENALDRETLQFAADARAAAAVTRDRSDGRVVIVYGSGTLTHDADMAVAAPALVALLRRRPEVVLRIVGPLKLGPELEALGRRRIERRPFENYRAYLAELARADIAIAPLEPTVFNDAKSNIKLLEASIVGLPSVCSPAAEFRRVITPGVDGFLASDTAEWLGQLDALVADPALRARVGAAADAAMRSRYDPRAVAERSVRPIVERLPPLRRARLRVLAVNIFWSPQSFGGATIVAEQMARGLASRPDTEVFAFASHGRAHRAPYTLTRYVDGGAGEGSVDTIGVALRPGHDEMLSFDNPEMGRAFADVLAAVRPDVVHVHCIQELGAALPRACQAAGIPYVVTLHDAWWLCPRQFMVRGDDTYCHQTTIDLKVCGPCVPHIGFLQSRMDILMQGLDAASLLLSPSAAHGALYAANGIPAARIRVNRNGVRPPAPGTRTTRTGPIRFAYVGGDQVVKGIRTVRECFTDLEREDWILRLVDPATIFGGRSFDPVDWKFRGAVEIVPGYAQGELDRFYADVDVLLFPSQWKESFGLAVREALIRDVWVIATRSGGAAEDIVDGVNGTLIPMRHDPAALRAAVTDVLDRADAIRAHRNLHRDAIATVDDQVDELATILAEVVGR